jgi:hypothetical protein
MLSNLATGGKQLCLNNCGRIAARRRRGLCNSCGRDPRIRRRFPMKRGGYAARPASERPGRKRPLPEPTNARPGSEEKIRVLMQRVEKRQQLWHPRDYCWTISADVLPGTSQDSAAAP